MPPLSAGTQGEHGCKLLGSGCVPIFLLPFLVEKEVKSSAEEQETSEVPGARETLQTLGKPESEHCRGGQQSTTGAEGHHRMLVIHSETPGSDSDNNKHAVLHIFQAPF